MNSASLNVQDAELELLRIELQARGSAIESDLGDEDIWSPLSSPGLTGRCIRSP